jgi:glucokinase
VRILSGDIGATHCRFALYRAEHALRAPELLGSRILKGGGYPSFNAALRTLLADGCDGPALLDRARLPDAAVIAPAGPVEGPPGNERCRMANLPWVVEAADLRVMLGTDRVALINDLVALAWACLLPEAAAVRRVLPGAAKPGAPAAVTAAGTGFGQALLLRPPAADEGASRRCPERAEVPGGEYGSAAAFPDPLETAAEGLSYARGLPVESGETGVDSGLAPACPERSADMLRRFAGARVLPSEGGHAEFPFAGAREFAFAAFAAARLGTDRLLCDHIVGGAGLTHILAFLGGPDVGPVEAAALCPQYPEALEWYARFYGRACRMYVLHTLALGGVYLAGGMAARLNVPESPAFAAEFRADSHPADLMRAVPVFHARNPHAGLLGAAVFGMLRFGERSPSLCFRPHPDPSAAVRS